MGHGAGLILLDTHVFVWLAAAHERLSAAALEAVDSEPERAICLVSVQELAYLAVRGRLAMDRPVDKWVGDALGVLEARALPPTVATSIRAGSLDPQEFHGDPIDRLIYATAVEHDALLVTADKRLRQFDPERTVW
ncbi:MAG TPA: type II toxin-antitoxin system VapC family toxin [Solirubrobacterales bacterium]|nr:type II toxin-antitoxin system VapC family toxin [Solirubrobacterales bacterium]